MLSVLAVISFALARHNHAERIFRRSSAKYPDERAVFSAAVSVNEAFRSGFFESFSEPFDSAVEFFTIISHNSPPDGQSAAIYPSFPIEFRLSRDNADFPSRFSLRDNPDYGFYPTIRIFDRVLIYSILFSAFCKRFWRFFAATISFFRLISDFSARTPLSDRYAPYIPPAVILILSLFVQNNE